MTTYEITYLTNTEETSDAKTIAGILTHEGAKIQSVHPWGARRKLSYPIKKQDQAFFTTVVFEAEPAALKPIDDALRLNNDVLRTLIVTFVPGIFHRAPQTEEFERREREGQKTETPAIVAPAEAVTGEAQPAAPVVTEVTPQATDTMPAKEAKPKKRAAKKTTEDKASLDKKIDELLKEDITR